MSLYVVGDIQGCYRELMMLLEKVGFSHTNDTLWCVGDLVARGPDSLETLKFFVNAPNNSVKTVLGNHDLSLISVLLGYREAKANDRLQAVIESRQRLDWVDWLRSQPLLHHKPKKQLLISHAGIYPWWSLEDAKNCASDVEKQLRSNKFDILIKNMFGDSPVIWDSSLTGYDRYRFIINAFTRMRFCTDARELDLAAKGPPDQQSSAALNPWYQYYQLPETAVFGHWAALMGQTKLSRVKGLDTGCVWGNYMTLWDVKRNVYYKQPAVG